MVIDTLRKQWLLVRGVAVVLVVAQVLYMVLSDRSYGFLAWVINPLSSLFVWWLWRKELLRLVSGRSAVRPSPE